MSYYNIVMKLRDFAPRLLIDPKKLTDYALSETHPRGKHKARVFRTILGYTSNNYEELLQQIEAQASEAEAVVQRIDGYGQHLRADLTIKGVAGQEVMVRTGWLIAPDSDAAFLSTLYVIGA
ncbi:DUF6883 domain-containing protein [Chloroflexota bacterium]